MMLAVNDMPHRRQIQKRVLQKPAYSRWQVRDNTVMQANLGQVPKKMAEITNARQGASSLQCCPNLQYGRASDPPYHDTITTLTGPSPCHPQQKAPKPPRPSRAN